MPKISRPIVYTLVGAVAVYAIFLVTQPDPPTTARPSPYRSAPAAAATDPTQPTAADLTAHFPRVAAGTHDPFIPKVLPATATGTASGSSAAGQWQLTGIYAIGSTLHALVEDKATGDSASLVMGGSWRGLHVVSIGTNAVRFENALGQQTRLAFPQPPAPGPVAGASVSPMPVTGPLRPLPPLPVSLPPNFVPGRPNQP